MTKFYFYKPNHNFYYFSLYNNIYHKINYKKQMMMIFNNNYSCSSCGK